MNNLKEISKLINSYKLFKKGDYAEKENNIVKIKSKEGVIKAIIPDVDYEEICRFYEKEKKNLGNK